MSIDWDKLANVEARMVDNESSQASESVIDLLKVRLDHLQTEDTPQDCHQALWSLDEVKNFMLEQKTAPFNDIPNLPQHDYSDAELELWAAMVAEYRQVALRAPKYSQLMIWSGIPPALRGKAWVSMCEGHSQTIESLYDSLAAEWTPFVKIIGRDLNRTFPEIGMFQEKGGDGQMKLGRVLRAYAAYDMQVGYCQGLTFLAGPLLLHMSDKEAFCVLVKLMEDYDVRSMFTADMSGLQLRMFQFDSLLESYLPELNSHFDNLGVNSIYASQWFLSFFAVTCPLSMLVRIYDLSFAEGAIPTLMRVALAVLKRNQRMLLQFDDEEQVLQHLLGRQLWDVYGYDADTLISDITSIGWDTVKCLSQLEKDFASQGSLNRSKSRRPRAKSVRKPQKGTSFASRLPFGLWSSANTSSTTLSKEQEQPQPISLTRSVSDCSFASDESSMQSSAASHRSSDSYTSYDDPLMMDSRSDYDRKLRELQTQLDRTRLALDSEKRARQADRDSVEALLAALPHETEDAKLKSSIIEVRTRFGITDGCWTDSTMTMQESTCKSCDRYLMELASTKTSEAMARQEIDELTDRIVKLSIPDNVNASPATTKSTKGWNLWNKQ